MKQYVCSICGYVHDEAVGGKWEDLPADWKCPLCGAGKDAFKPKEEKTASQEVLEKPHVDKELSPMEMSIICSNLARGCEKQYLPQQADDFRKLAEFFRSKAAPVEEASTAKLLELIQGGCKKFALCHLSQENNTPMLALQTVFSTLGTAGVVPDKDCIVQTQRRNEVSPALAF